MTTSPSEQVSKWGRQKHRYRDLGDGLHVIPRAPAHRPELYVVDCADLAPIVTAEIQKMDRDHPRHPQQFGPREVVQVLPRVWIAAAIQSSERTIWRIEKGEGRVGFSFADALLTVLGLEHLVCDLPLYPNPVYSRKGWIRRARNARIATPAREFDEMLARRIARIANGSSSVTAPG